MYFYSDTAVREHTDINVWKMNGSKAYLRHFSNYLFLNFVSVKGTREERASVEKEIQLCERKLKFWERHPNFDPAFVQAEKEKMIKQWRQDGSGKTSAP